MLLNDPQKRPHVLLIAEGTYPYHFGGVSTWCHILIHDLPEVDFTLLNCRHPTTMLSRSPRNARARLSLAAAEPTGLLPRSTASDKRRGSVSITARI